MGTKTIAALTVVQFTFSVGVGHAGESRSSTERKLDDLAEAIVIQGMSPGLRCLRGILRVVVDSLRPLSEAVRASLGEPPT